MSQLLRISMNLMERGLLPDPVIRAGLRRLLKEKLVQEEKDGLEFGQERLLKFINHLKVGQIAIPTSAVNRQHDELPTEFFQLILGRHMKYSSGYWRHGVKDFDQSEEDMLEITTERADLANGQSILELGCGWGALSLFMARKFPRAKILAVSDSQSQKVYIDQMIRERCLDNLEVVTADMNDFTTHHRFDRVVSIEMFERMRNYQKLLEKVSLFLHANGKLFVHIFTHKDYGYFYDDTNAQDFIAQYFFTGGIMPSDHLLLYFQDHFKIEHHWRVSGTHYQKTSEAWLQRMDENREKILPILRSVYGPQDARKWWNYWRVFFMACAELWGYDNGSQWIVSHYLFRKR